MRNGVPAIPVVPEIAPEERTPLVERLLAIIDLQQQRIVQLEEIVQQWRDEMAILKGQKPRPKIAPSRLEQPAPPTAATAGEQRPGSHKRSKNAELTIHRTEELLVPEAPPGSVLKEMREHRADLLRVLQRPEVPLHNNGIESDIREYVKKRKISGSTRSHAGRRCRDTFASLKKTCRKLGVKFWQYLQDRLRGLGTIPRLAELIRQRAAEATAGIGAAVPI